MSYYVVRPPGRPGVTNLIKLSGPRQKNMSAPTLQCYVLLAHFDIDRGSIIKAQYPQAMGVPESYLAELMLPEGAHLRPSDSTIFFLKKSDVDKSLATSDELLYCLSLVKTKINTSARRGAVVFSLALCLPHRYIDIFKPLLEHALDEYLDTNSTDKTNDSAYGDPQPMLKSVFEAIEMLNLSQLAPLTDLDLRMMRSNTMTLAALAAEHVPTLTTDLPVRLESSSAQALYMARVPNYVDDDSIGGVSMLPLLAKFRDNIMQIYNALLTEKRVLFLGHNQPASLVCQFVLSACMLISPPLSGVLHRAHPYATLTNMEFLKTPGYIAGVTNPIFEQHSSWFDLCCNIATGDITLSPTYQKLLLSQSERELEVASISENQLLLNAAHFDALFVNDLMAKVEGARPGTSNFELEAIIQTSFRDYTQSLVSLAYGEEEFVDDVTHIQHVEANAARINACKRSRSFMQAHSRRQQWQQTSSLSESDFGSISHFVRSLQVGRSLTVDSIVAALEILIPSLKTSAIAEIMTMFADSLHGLEPLAALMLHKDARVRSLCLLALRLIDASELPACQLKFGQLNYLYLMAYERARAVM